VLICVRIPTILGKVYSISLSHILFVKKCEQMLIWFDFCELKFCSMTKCHYFFGRCRRPKRSYIRLRDRNNAAQTPRASIESRKDSDDNVTCRRDAPTFRDICDIFRYARFKINFCLLVQPNTFVETVPATGRLEQYVFAP
jgi:hypothetical protein